MVILKTMDELIFRNGIIVTSDINRKLQYIERNYSHLFNNGPKKNDLNYNNQTHLTFPCNNSSNTKCNNRDCLSFNSTWN